MKLFRYRETIENLEIGDVVEIQPGILIITNEKINNSIEGTVLVVAQNGEKQILIDALLDEFNKLTDENEKQVYMSLLKLL